MSPRGIQYVLGFFSEEEKQESIRIEDSAPEGAIISNQAPDGGTSTMVLLNVQKRWKGLEIIYIHTCEVYYTRKRMIP